jgi:uncharacterized delta-60 repeat protein
LARCESDGTLDPAFPYNFLYVDTLGIASAVRIRADGKIIVAGASIAGYTAREARFSIVRYNPDGTLDAAFGEGGRVYGNPTHGSDGAFAMAVQADGKIVAAGGGKLDSDHPKFAPMRFLDGGQIS